MKLEVSRMSDLAIRALLALDPEGPRVKGVELASRLGTTPAYMAQIMMPLVHQGWVDSGPGRTGGYRLAADLAGVSVLDVIEVVEGPTDTGRCVVAESKCGEGRFCALHDAWSRARAVLSGHLASTPVAAVGVDSDGADSAAADTATSGSRDGGIDDG